MSLESALTSEWWKIYWNEITTINASERSLEASCHLQTQYDTEKSIEKQKIKPKLLTVNHEIERTIIGRPFNELPLFMPRKGMYKVSKKACILRNSLFQI